MAFTFTDNVVLEDDRVLLRPLELSDISYLLPFSLHEPEIWRYSLVGADGEENLKKYVQSAVKAKEDKKEYPFIVFDKQKDKYAGSTRFYDVQLNNAALQLGYTWYGKEFRGSGLNVHCKFLMLDFAFGTMGMERVEFRADNKNARSIAAMKSIGCTVEGVLRSTAPTFNGERRDSIVLSILRSEWEKELRSNLRNKLLNADHS